MIKLNTAIENINQGKIVNFRIQHLEALRLNSLIDRGVDETGTLLSLNDKIKLTEELLKINNKISILERGLRLFFIEELRILDHSIEQTLIGLNRFIKKLFGSNTVTNWNEERVFDIFRKIQPALSTTIRLPQKDIEFLIRINNARSIQDLTFTDIYVLDLPSDVVRDRVIPSIVLKLVENDIDIKMEDIRKIRSILDLNAWFTGPH